jgi:hypothetical protein
MTDRFVPLLVLFLFVCGAGCRRDAPEGVYPCSHPGTHVGAPECPTDWYCRLDSHCWSSADPALDAGSADASSRDGSTPGDAGGADADDGATILDASTDAADVGRDAPDSGPTCVPTAPSTEICDNLDNDCDGHVDGAAADASCGASEVCSSGGRCAARLLWSRAFDAASGGVGRSTAFAVAVDEVGNAYVAGQINKAVDFGGGPLPFSGSFIWFVASFDTAGAHRWSRSFGTTTGYVTTMAVMAGQVVFGGLFNGTVTVHGVPHTAVAGTGDGLLVALDATTGADRWALQLHAPTVGSAVSGLALSIDGAGRAVFAAQTTGPIDAGGGSRGSSGANVLLGRCTSGGAHEWSRAISGGSYVTRPISFSDRVDFAFNVDASPVDFGNGTAVAGGRIAVTSVDPTTGSYLRAARIGSDSGTLYSGLFRGTAGSCVTGGQLVADVGTTSGGFVACLDPSTLALGGRTSWPATSLGASGNAYGTVVNTGSSALAWGRASIPPMASAVVALADASAGDWARTLPSTFQLNDLAAVGHVLVVGGTTRSGSASVDFGEGPRVGKVVIAAYGI